MNEDYISNHGIAEEFSHGCWPSPRWYPSQGGLHYHLPGFLVHMSAAESSVTVLEDRLTVGWLDMAHCSLPHQSPVTQRPSIYIQPEPHIAVFIQVGNARHTNTIRRKEKQIDARMEGQKDRQRTNQAGSTHTSEQRLENVRLNSKDGYFHTAPHNQFRNSPFLGDEFVSFQGCISPT